MNIYSLLYFGYTIGFGTLASTPAAADLDELLQVLLKHWSLLLALRLSHWSLHLPLKLYRWSLVLALKLNHWSLVLASKLNHWSMLLALKWNRWSLHLACHFENVAVTLGVGVHPCAPVPVAELEESNHRGNLEWQA
jgi:hypothetical protein